MHDYIYKEYSINSKEIESISSLATENYKKNNCFILFDALLKTRDSIRNLLIIDSKSFSI